jgi:hypothetical protein
MARYKLQVHCNVCGDVHSLPIACVLGDGPLRTTSIRQALKDRNAPEWLATVPGTKLTCPSTGSLIPTSPNDILLVPMADIAFGPPRPSGSPKKLDCE